MLAVYSHFDELMLYILFLESIILDVVFSVVFVLMGYTSMIINVLGKMIFLDFAFFFFSDVLIYIEKKKRG